MSRRRLIATDLDRTLLPNGAQPESPGARELLAAFIQAESVTLAFVTGRRLALVEDAIAEYGLPRPDHVLADVGSSLYASKGTHWEASEKWAAWLAEDWGGKESGDLVQLFAEEATLVLQEPEAQRPFKLSFFCDSSLEAAPLCDRLSRKLESEGLRSVVIHSLDEGADCGLIDILPQRSAKRRALEFLVEALGLPHEEVLFAGDSGNDLDALVGALPAVLVANADPAVRSQARQEADRLGRGTTLHLATGRALGMNGNYAAGILEGWLHFHPEDRGLLEELARNLGGDFV